MKRYRGESLPANPKIALVTNDNLGNFVIATPLMQMLRERHGGRLDYFGGTRVMELASNSDLIDDAIPLHGSNVRASALAMATKNYDLIVNLEWTTWAKAASSILAGRDTFVCGPCLGQDGRGDLAFPEDETGSLWNDQDWISNEVTSTHPFLRSGFIAEIFCRLAYLEGEIPRYKLPKTAPDCETPDVWVSGSASLPEKLWPLDHWIQVFDAIWAKGLKIGLLGAKPSVQGQFWKGATDEDKFVEAGVIDFRGVFTLPQVVSAIEGAKAVVSLDNGILHLTCATETPVVGLFREGIHRLWAPPNPNLSVLHPGAGDPVSSIPASEVVKTLDARIFKDIL